MGRVDLTAGETVSVLELDPDLAAGLSAPELATASGRLRARTLQVQPGAWSPPQQGENAFGLLILDGVIGRDVVLAGIACSELLAPGDLLKAPGPEAAERAIPMVLEWWATERSTVALLDERFAAVAQEWPPVVSALLERAVGQSQSSALHLAITCLKGVKLRVHVLFWHLSERFGRVTPDGIIVPLGLTHAMLARLVRARRPSVTLALGELREEGLVSRRDDGVWLLRGEPPAEVREGAGPSDARPTD